MALLITGHPQLYLGITVGTLDNLVDDLQGHTALCLSPDTKALESQTTTKRLTREPRLSLWVGGGCWVILC